MLNAVTPLDVVKTRLQAQTHSDSSTVVSASTANKLKVRYLGTVDAFVKIGSREGVKGLWRGLGPALVMTVPSTTIYFSLYEFLKAKIEDYAGTGYLTPLLAGSIGRAFAVGATSPIDLFRVNRQSHSREIGSVQLFRDIVNSGRWSTFWVGVRPTLWRDVPFSGIYWMIYEFLRSEIVRSRQVRSNFVTSLSAGAIAGSIAGILTLPFDVLKTRVQMNVDKVANGKLAASQLPTSTFGAMADIAAKEGVRALFQGLLPRVFKVAPACAIMISSYELVKEFFVTKRAAEADVSIASISNSATHNALAATALTASTAKHFNSQQHNVTYQKPIR